MTTLGLIGAVVKLLAQAAWLKLRGQKIPKS